MNSHCTIVIFTLLISCRILFQWFSLTKLSLIWFLRNLTNTCSQTLAQGGACLKWNFLVELWFGKSTLSAGPPPLLFMSYRPLQRLCRNVRSCDRVLQWVCCAHICSFFFFCLFFKAEFEFSIRFWPLGFRVINSTKSVLVTVLCTMLLSYWWLFCLPKEGSTSYYHTL